MGCLAHYPGLRLLRSLTLGYHISPLQGFKLVLRRIKTIGISFAHRMFLHFADCVSGGTEFF
jgi:hypothetical protein